MENFDGMQTFSILALATHQLERALRLFLDEGDYVCAITLAGASEEILGRLLVQPDRKHALGSWVDACVMIGKEIHGEDWEPREFASMANAFRNRLKHHGKDDGETITVPKEAAMELLDRAIENYSRLTSDLKPLMLRYNAEAHG
jgi:hypothetical protein